MFVDIITPEKNRLEYEIDKLGAHPYAKKAVDKGLPLNIKIRGVSSPLANIIKQEAIASSIDAVVHMRTFECGIDKTDVLLCGNVYGIKQLIERLKVQPFGLKDLADKLSDLLNCNISILRIQGEYLNLDEKVLMAIINVTPDSFSDGGVFTDLNVLERYLLKLKDMGVGIVDIGGESTRPGSDRVTEEEELKRVLPAVDLAVKHGFIVSIDTYKSRVAEKALRNGAKIINDISGFTFDQEMPFVCAEYDAAVCLMHIKGEPKTMQDVITYDNMLEEIKMSLCNSVERAIKAGVNSQSIIIDPGFGFGKNLEDNYVLLRYLKEFKSIGKPLLVGLSRKSMIGNILKKPPEKRITGTIIAETIALMNGADIIRVHDVEDAIDLLKIFNFYSKVA